MVLQGLTYILSNIVMSEESCLFPSISQTLPGFHCDWYKHTLTIKWGHFHATNNNFNKVRLFENIVYSWASFISELDCPVSEHVIYSWVGLHHVRARHLFLSWLELHLSMLFIPQKSCTTCEHVIYFWADPHYLRAWYLFFPWPALLVAMLFILELTCTTSKAGQLKNK